MNEKERMSNKNNMTLKLEKMTKKSIVKNQISRNELSKKRSLQERGITLIALVVTIIILLILAGVTLNIALSDNGLFSETKEAAEKYKQAQSDEEEMVRQIATQMYSEYVGVEVTGYEPEPDDYTLEKEISGYEESQILKTNENMRWRIWDFDGNTLRIIGDPTEERIYFQGATGYNNGIWALDYICNELYSNNKGVKVTNLRKTDIQKVSTYDYTQYKHKPNEAEEAPNENAEDTIQFGEVVEYDNAYYPEMWNANDKNWTYEWNDDNGTITGEDKECTIWEKNENIKEELKNKMQGGSSKIAFKSTYYWHHYGDDEFINKKYYDLIFKKTNGDLCGLFWLASRMMSADSGIGYFGLVAMEGHTKGGYIHGESVCKTDGTDMKEYSSYLRPIVSINLKESGCTMTKETSADGKVTYKLEWAQS